MRKLNLKVALNVLVIIATVVLAVFELITKGTITGLSLIPFTIKLISYASKLVVTDWKAMMNLIESAEED